MDLSRAPRRVCIIQRYSRDLLGFSFPAASGIVFNILTINRYRVGEARRKEPSLIISGSWLEAGAGGEKGNERQHLIDKRKKESHVAYYVVPEDPQKKRAK